MPQTEVRRAVEIANQLNPDLAVLTGDLISFDGDLLEACIAELSRLRAPLGIWGCNGNHELYAEVEGASQVLFERYGMSLLRQQNTELQWRGGKLNLIGVDYQRGSAPFSEQSSMVQSIESLSSVEELDRTICQTAPRERWDLVDHLPEPRLRTSRLVEHFL